MLQDANRASGPRRGPSMIPDRDRDRVLAYLREQRAKADEAPRARAPFGSFARKARQRYFDSARTLLPALLDVLIAEVERHVSYTTSYSLFTFCRGCKTEGPCRFITAAAKLVPADWKESDA